MSSDTVSSPLGSPQGDTVPSGGDTVKIVALGSSGTYGHQVEQSQAWPSILEELLQAAGHEVEVFNYASMGVSLEAFFERILVLEEHLAPDAYILQLPISTRAYFGINGTGKIPEETLPQAELLGWRSLDDARYSKPMTRILWSQGAAKEDTKFFPVIKRYFYPLCKRNSDDVTYEDLLSFLQFWDKHVADSDVRHLQYGKEIVALQHYLSSQNRPFCMFDWIKSNTKDEPRLGPFAKVIDFSKFVNHGAENAYTFLEKNWDGDPDAYKADEHGHPNVTGHRFLAQRFVLPWIVQEILPKTLPGA